MSRLNSAIDSIQNAVDELRGAVDAHLAQAENHSEHMSDTMSADNAANGGAEIHEDELRAMKSELHEAMTLLQAIQNPAQDQEGQ